jgi:general secretion pathway protein F
MTVFNFIAVNEKGKSQKGILEGDSPSHIREILKDRGLIPIAITVSTQTHNEQGSLWERLTKRRQSVSIANLSVMTYQFATLLSAGLPVESAIANIAAELDNATLKQVLLSVRGRVLEGHTLAYGMREYPAVFPKLYVASVDVGEKTGQLDRVLTRLADYYEKQRAVQEKIFAAMVYPTLLTLVAGAVVVFLLAYVIPQVTNVFTQTGQTLPTVTIILLATSNWLQAYGLYVLLFFLFAFIGFRYALSYPHFRYRYHEFLLRLPVISKTITAIQAARFLRTFGILFAAGVPVIDAMTSANSIINLLPMQAAIERATRQVGEGKSIHQSLQQTEYFSSLSTQLIASGEAGGELEVMLEKAASFQEQNTAHKLSTALALFEPILILAMGSIVLFIVLAVLLPIFEMNQLIH